MARKGSRPKLTDKVRESITRDLGVGVPLKFAALRAGISERQVFYWLALGRQGKTNKNGTDFVSFYTAVEKAKADAVARMVMAIQVAGRKTWQANAWTLERCYPESFGSDRREIYLLKKEIAELRKAVQDATTRQQSAESDLVDLGHEVKHIAIG
jgi:hypothetical protein